MKTNKPTANLVNPGTYSNGACRGCAGGNKCAWHIEEDAKRDLQWSKELSRICGHIKQARIERVYSRFELESDEMATREEKAESMLIDNPLLA